METFEDLLVLRDELWSQVSELPGVVTIGIGSKNDRATLVVFVDENKVHKADLPTEYADLQVVLEPTYQAKAHGA